MVGLNVRTDLLTDPLVYTCSWEQETSGPEQKSQPLPYGLIQHLFTHGHSHS